MNSILRSMYKTIISSLSFSVLKALKIGKLAHNLALPLLATELTFIEFLGVALVRTGFKLFFLPFISLFGFFYYMPTFIGSLYFKAAISKSTFFSRLIQFLAPLACMALFVNTTVGGQAWIYSLYWVLPALIAFLPHNSIFLAALGSTFMTHAVGSVLFIYCTPMTPSFWITLLPVVLFERCLFAAGITATYSLARQFKKIAASTPLQSVNA